MFIATASPGFRSSNGYAAIADLTADCIVPRCRGVPISLWATTTTSPVDV